MAIFCQYVLIRKSANFKPTKKAKKKPVSAKPLFPFGDWITIITGVFLLSHTDGMGHHLGHASIFLLMLTLIARPISFLWNQPLKHRRTIGILVFATALAHTIYAFSHALDGNFATIFNMTSRHQWGVGAGIISLAAMTPAAITSFKFFQKKLGKKWRQIHLLTVPALAIACLHTILIGPHYLAQFNLDILDLSRTCGMAIATCTVLLMRRRIFWSILGFKKR